MGKFNHFFVLGSIILYNIILHRIKCQLKFKNRLKACQVI
jgi:hypothetical protein